MFAIKNFENLLYYFDDFFDVILSLENTEYYNNIINTIYKKLKFFVQKNKYKIYIIINFFKIELNVIKIKTRFLSEKLYKIIELMNVALKKKSISIENF